MIPRTFLLLLAAFTVPVWPQEVTNPGQVLSTSPDGGFQVRRFQADPGERGEARKTLSVTTAAGKTLYAWDSALGATTVLWSPDSRYVAVNDMPGEKGDQMFLLAIDPSSRTAIPLRDRNGSVLKAEVEKRHGSFLSRIEKAVLRASDWKEGRLWCTVTGTFAPKRQPAVHVPFHHLWVYKVDGTNPPVLEQEWTLTDPKERPTRDLP